MITLRTRDKYRVHEYLNTLHSPTASNEPVIRSRSSTPARQRGGLYFSCSGGRVRTGSYRMRSDGGGRLVERQINDVICYVKQTAADWHQCYFLLTITK